MKIIQVTTHLCEGMSLAEVSLLLTYFVTISPLDGEPLGEGWCLFSGCSESFESLSQGGYWIPVG